MILITRINHLYEMKLCVSWAQTVWNTQIEFGHPTPFPSPIEV